MTLQKIIDPLCYFFKRFNHTYTHTHTHTSAYIYIYVYLNKLFCVYSTMILFKITVYIVLPITVYKHLC